MRNTYKALIIFMIVLFSLYILAVVIQNIQHINATIAIILFVVLLMFIFKNKKIIKMQLRSIKIIFTFLLMCTTAFYCLAQDKLNTKDASVKLIK